MNTQTPHTPDLSKWTAEQKNELRARLLNEAKAEKETLKENKKAFKELSGEFVEDNIDLLLNHKNATESIINNLFKDYKSIKELKAEIYGTKQQDSHTSTLEDGTASITIGHNVTIGFDGTESAGIEIIKTYIAGLSSDNDNVKKLSKIVNTFLKPNAKTGQLNPSKIIELNKLRDEFNSEDFDRGLDIIIDAQNRHQNSMYVSGWKTIELEDGQKKKLEFRFTV